MNIKVYLQTTGLCLAKQKVEPIQNRMLPLANQEDNDKLKCHAQCDLLAQRVRTAQFKQAA